ncbi:MAG: hypothetical protein EKK53_15260 [Burkholderiales bacterium]|nr:MAG: hypothetical protein EKK53_15260 [Burkholderiales bacterium]
MKLNCKPGDLARVIRDDVGIDEQWPGVLFRVHSAGFIVRCRALTVIQGYPAWELEQPVEARSSTPSGFSGVATVYAIADELLRPLPGLGELAGDDETIAWVGKPVQADVPEVISA